MGNLKFVVFVVACVILTSCGSKKKVLESVTTELKEISYALPGENTLIIESICDTIVAGESIQVNQVISNPVSDTKVQLKNNRLIVTTKTDTVFKDKIVLKDKLVTETKEVPYTPKWIKTLIWILLTYTFLSIVFPGIPRAINVMARKLITGFI